MARTHTLMNVLPLPLRMTLTGKCVRNACLIEEVENVSDQLSLPGIRVSDWHRWAEYLLLLSIAALVPKF
jgi:hypothetical protein